MRNQRSLDIVAFRVYTDYVLDFSRPGNERHAFTVTPKTRLSHKLVCGNQAAYQRS